MYLIATQCFPPTLGGIEIYMGGLADALAEWGKGAVHVLADGVRRPEDAEKPYVIERFGGPKPVRRWWKRSAASARLASGDFERVFVDSYKSLAVLPRHTSARVICLAHGMEFPADPRPKKAERMRELFQRADVVLANSHYTAELAQPYLSAAEKLVVVTPPLPEQPEPSPAVVAEIEQMFYGCRPVVATLGRLEPRKGVDQLIASLPTVAAFHPSLVLAIAGGGPDKPRLQARAKQFGVEERVRFMGRISDEHKAALFARANLFAMPARREGDSVEGFGLVYLEAAYQGTPSLAGLEGGAVDAVLDGQSGRFCDGADIESVAATLGEMLADTGGLADMRDTSAAWARANRWRERIRDFLIV